MKPVYISVDCEFTDGDLVHGQLMQLGMVSIETGTTWSAILPVTTEAVVSPWVRKNLQHLVSAALQTASWSSHLPPIQVAGQKVPADLVARVGGAFKWVRQQQLLTYWAVNDITDKQWRETSDPAKVAEDFPAVLVAYCGGYDFAFTTQLFNRCGMVSPFHYEMVDISPLALGVFPELAWGFAQTELEQRLGMEPNDRVHDALADANHQAEMFRRLMKLRQEK